MPNAFQLLILKRQPVSFDGWEHQASYWGFLISMKIGKSLLIACLLAGCAAAMSPEKAEVVSAAGDVSFVKVTSADSIKDGDTAIFVSQSDKVMGDQGNKIRDISKFDFNENANSLADDWCVVRFDDAGNDNWNLYCTNLTTGYLNYNGSSNNVLTTENVSAGNIFSVTESDKVADTFLFTIQNGSAKKYFTYNNSNPRWACYDKQSQQTFYIYKIESATFGEIDSLEIISAPDKTDYLAGDAFEIDGLEVLATDTDGNTKLIDNSELSIEPAVGYVFQEDDIGTAEVTIRYSESGKEFTLGGGKGDAWEYTVHSLDESSVYTILEKANLFIGSKVVLGGIYSGNQFVASDLQTKSHYLQVVSPDSFDSERGSVSFVPTNENYTEYELRIAGEGKIALFAASDGYLSMNGSGDMEYSKYMNDETSWSVNWDDSGKQILLSIGSRSLAYNYNGGSNPRIKGYSTSDLDDFTKIALYSLEQTPSEQGTELARYLLEEDTVGQCKEKFPIAKDAYLNLMSSDGREWFASNEQDAYERYVAWAAALNENPFENSPAAAYTLFSNDGETTAWAAAAIMAIVTAAAGALFVAYKKRKQA